MPQIYGYIRTSRQLQEGVPGMDPWITSTAATAVWVTSSLKQLTRTFTLADGYLVVHFPAALDSGSGFEWK